MDNIKKTLLRSMENSTATSENEFTSASVRMPTKLLERLDKVAAKQMRSRSNLIIMWLTKAAEIMGND